VHPRAAIASAALVGAGLLSLRRYRSWQLRWGATDEEVAQAMPGDELVPRPAFNATRAITIRARPEEIWPWIVQIGFGRAGFYSYDLLDNLGRRSAERIIPELQDPAVGDWVPMASRVSEETAFRVGAFQPNRWMLWTKAASTWAWTLRPVDEQHTRVVTRLRAAYRWTRPTILSDLVLMEVADFPMLRKLLLNLRRRAQGSGSAAAAAPVANPELVPG
jgi:hypothetical protein